MSGFDVIALRAVCKNYVDQMVMPVLEDIQQSQANLRTEMQQLSDAVQKKAAAQDVPTLAHFESLMAAQNSSITNVEEVLAKLQLKDSADDHAILMKLEERTANTEKTMRSHAAKIAELRDIGQAIEGKANARDVPNLTQFKKLEGTVAKKANTAKVPTLEQFEELRTLAESKVSAHWVPSMQQFEKLAAQVEKKANASNVLSSAEFKSIQEEMQQKANINDTPRAAWIEEQLEKANTCQATTQSSVDKLASVIEKKLAFLASRVQKNTEALDHFQQPGQQAMICYVPAAACGTWGPVGAPTEAACGTWGPVSSPTECGWSVQSESSNSGGEGFAPGGWGECTPKEP